MGGAVMCVQEWAWRCDILRTIYVVRSVKDGQDNALQASARRYPWPAMAAAAVRRGRQRFSDVVMYLEFV